MSQIIKAPFTEEQVLALNEYQHLGIVHPFTCGLEGCKKSEQENDGVLIATEQGWICPCGKYKQDWAHAFMAELYVPPPPMPRRKKPL
jgi:hypothetical protein